jgi:hypothetical protein
MSTRNLPLGKGRLARKAENFTSICEADCLEIVGASTSHGLLQGEILFLVASTLVMSSRILVRFVNDGLEGFWNEVS